MKTIIFYFIVLLLGISCKSSNNYDNIHAKVSDIAESVYASVKVEPLDKYVCRPIGSGNIQDIFVKEGDRVSKGQVLFTISHNPGIENRIRNARINVSVAKANLEGENNLLQDLEIELNLIFEKNQLDSINYYRNKRLWEKEIGTKNTLETSLLAFQNSKNQLRLLRNKIAQTKLSLESKYAIAKNQLSTEQSQLEDFQVKSEIEGIVYSVNKQIGDFISPQESFAEIGGSNEFVVEMNIDEIDIPKIELSDTAFVKLDAYPGNVYPVMLSSISNKKNEIRQTFEVKGFFLKEPPKLYSGLSGEANILVERRKNTLVIPSSYLVTSNTVRTRDGEKEVKIGIKNIEFVEILSGIDSTTILLKPDAS